MKQPLVSVMMTCYNQAEFIREAVLSVVEQDYPNLQVVVSDDASTDGSQDVLAELAAAYPERLTVLLNKENIGVAANRNRSLFKCKGTYIAYMDGDDIMLSGKIRRQAEFMSAHSDCSISYHNVEVFDSLSGEVLYNWRERFGAKEGSAKNAVRYGPFVPSVSCMFRANHLPPEGFDERIWFGEDWLLIIQILMGSGGKLQYLDEILARHRRHASNLTLQWEEKLTNQMLVLAFVESLYPQLAMPARLRRADIYLMQAFIHLRKGDCGYSLRLLYRSMLQSFPFLWNSLRLPLRELSFFLRNRLRFDPVAQAIWNPGLEPEGRRSN